jgi:oligoendopeptidase F
MYQKQQDSDFVVRYLELLSQGGSRSPAELLRPFDIDLQDPTFWHGGLQIIEEMLREIEQG